MNYHQNPYLAARVIRTLYCPEGQKIIPQNWHRRCVLMHTEAGTTY